MAREPDEPLGERALLPLDIENDPPIIFVWVEEDGVRPGEGRRRRAGGNAGRIARDGGLGGQECLGSVRPEKKGLWSSMGFYTRHQAGTGLFVGALGLQGSEQRLSQQLLDGGEPFVRFFRGGLERPGIKASDNIGGRVASKRQGSSRAAVPPVENDDRSCMS